MITTYSVRRITKSGEVINDFEGNPEYVAAKLVEDIKAIHPQDTVFMVAENYFELKSSNERIGFRRPNSVSYED